MAVDKKISQLASGAPAQAGDEYVVARSGANYKLTLTNIAASMPPIGATTPNTGAFTTLSASSGATISGGNLTFSSTAQRITGDMSNATHVNRLSFQSSVTNGATSPFFIPNGTGTSASVVVANASDPTNSSFGQFIANGSTDVRVTSGILGTGTYLPMTFYTGGSERVRIDTSGNMGIGLSSLTIPLQIGKGGGGNPATSGTTQTYGIARIGSSGAAALDVGTYAAGQVWMQGVNVTNLATNYDLVLQPNGGNVGIGVTPAGNARLNMSGTMPVLSGNANSNCVSVAMEAPSSITGSVFVFRSIPSIAASTATTNVYHYLATNATLGAGASLTNSFGFYADPLTSATNNYGFYSNIASGSNRWNFYAAGTARNYFAGSTGIGIAPDFALHVYGAGSTSNNYANGAASGATLAVQDSGGSAGNGGQIVFGSSFGINAGIKSLLTNGTGPAGDMVFQTRSTSGDVLERLRIDSAGNVIVNTAAIATSATDGFLYVPTCAGVPTGTPSTLTGRAPIVIDTTNHRLYFYSGGSWRNAGP
jgi:hypothetical protein